MPAATLEEHGLDEGSREVLEQAVKRILSQEKTGTVHAVNGSTSV